jgi:hypothetical protein
MTWTVACFCGNVYSAPPDRCKACGRTLERVSADDAGTPRTGTPPTCTASLPSAPPKAGAAPTTLLDCQRADANRSQTAELSKH